MPDSGGRWPSAPSRVPLARQKDDLIEKWIRSPGATSREVRPRLPGLGKPAAVRRGKARLGPAASEYRRRAVVICYHYKLAGSGYSKLHSHLVYLERPGAGERSVGAPLFDRDSDDVLGHSAVKAWRDDRHYFRILVAPEDGGRLDMRAYTREFMAELERELGTQLEWMATVHEKPDAAHAANRHVHVVIRGIDDRGADLVMGREFIRHELRRIAADVATRHLGQMSQRELDALRARQDARAAAGGGNYDLGYRRRGLDGEGTGGPGGAVGERRRRGGQEHG